MRVLFTTQPAYGHFHPVVPLAHALRDAGHEVAVASSRSFAPVIEASGLRAFGVGIDWTETGNGLGRAFPVLREVPVKESNAFVVGRVFAGVTAMRAVPDLLGVAAEWRADVVVRESTEFGGLVAADLLGIPHATVQVAAYAVVEDHRDDIVQGLSLVRSSFGLDADLELESLYRHLLLSFVPPSFQLPDRPLPPTAHALRSDSFDRSGDGELPEWVASLPDRPTIYMTLGTVFNVLTDLYRTAIEAFEDLDVNGIITVGPGQDPAQFDPLPSNVRVARYIPQSLLAPHCDVVVNHGGFGTIMSAVAHGLPVVLVPLAADNMLNAARVEDLGIGRVIARGEFDAGSLRAAVSDVLHDEKYRHASRRLQAEMRALPGVERGVELLERLVEMQRAGGPAPAA